MSFAAGSLLGAGGGLARTFSSSAMARSRQGLQGKVAVVTASTEGIGLGIARRLASDGCNVVISSRKESNVSKAVEQLRSDLGLGADKLIGLPCHVGKNDDRRRLVAETVSRMGGIDILVSNAATNPVFGETLECSEETWDKIFDVNVKSAFLLTQLVVPEMDKRPGGGSIVFVSSVAGFQPMPMLGPYSVSKTALLGLTKALSSELAPRSVRVNCVAPGIVETKFASALTGNEALSEKLMETIHIKRFGTPEDVAGAVSFLCSDDASYITGENLVVGGGFPARL